MRCKKHLSDHSSSVGVCASCLRHRLLSLIHSQTHPSPNPTPLVFPKSVSPYRSGPGPAQIQRFYSTPQVDRRKKHGGKFNLNFISKLFRSRSTKSGPSDQAECASQSHSYYCNAKGMSPDREWAVLESPARNFPRPSPGRVRPGPSRSGIALCLTPLVRPSPARQWSFGPDVSFSGEISSGSGNNNNNNKPHLAAAASFCANRSRKIADFGRLNRNR